MKNKNFYVYILLCKNNSYYTGYTNDLEKRYHSHLNGTASKYTRSFPPIKIAQHWEFNNKSTAMRIERYIKKLPRKQKEQLIISPALLANIFGI